MEISLESQLNIISLEAESGIDGLKQAVTRLPAFFKGVTKNLSESIGSILSTNLTGAGLTAATQALSDTAYSDLRKLEVPCVPGLIGDYPSYVKDLLEAAEFSHLVPTTYVAPFTHFVASKLANLSAMRSAEPDASIKDLSIKPIEVIHKKVLSHLTFGHQVVDTAPYGTLVARNADWEGVNAHAMKIKRLMSDGDHKTLEKAVHRCDELTSLLISRLRSNPREYSLSATTVEETASAAYACASAVELYAFTLRNATVLDVALSRLAAFLKNKAAA